MGILNSALNAIFDLIIQPLRGLHPIAGLLLVSIIMAVVALLAFRVASNAAAITRIKTRIGAYLLEMRLFSDDLRVLLTDPVKILALNAKYVAHAFVPFLLILPPMLLAIFQIESRYSWRPLAPDERTILTIACREGTDVLAPGLVLETSDGLEVETAPVRIPSLGEVSWRLRATAAGEQWVRVVPPGGAEAQATTKLVWVGDEPKAMARARSTRYAGFAALAEPAEPPLARGGIIQEIRIDLPERESRPLGLSTSVWIFFLLATAFGFLLKSRLGVTL
jgi:hypothetical protein